MAHHHFKSEPGYDVLAAEISRGGAYVAFRLSGEVGGKNFVSEIEFCNTPGGPEVESYTHISGVNANEDSDLYEQIVNLFDGVEIF